MDVVAALGDWASARGPLHRKLAAGVAAAVERGALRPGDRLPAERALAAALAVSRSTVVAAYDALEADGLLERRHGSGTRVAPDVPRRLADGSVEGGTAGPIFQRLLDGPGEVISLACASGPGSPAVAEALAEVAADPLLHRLLAGPGYLPLGLPELRRAIAVDLTRRGLPTQPEEVLVTTGAHQAIELCSRLLVRRGDAVLVEAPSFPGCIDVFRADGARLLGVPVDRHGLLIDPALAALRSGPLAAAYVMPTFHNPVGGCLPEHRRRAFAEAAADAGVPVIEDDALQGARIGEDEPPPPLAAYAPRDGLVLTIGSLSKSVWGGLRTGWVRAPGDVVERLGRLKALADLGSPLLDQAVAARLVPRLDVLEAERTAELRTGLAALEAGLREHVPTWTWDRPDGGPSLWVRLPSGDAGQLGQVALRHGVELVSGTAMAPDGGFEDHLRIPFTLAPPLLGELARRLGLAWRRYAADRPPAGSSVPLVV